MEYFYQGTGWVGALILLAAFYTSVTQRYTPQSRPYLWLNFSGSILLIINATHYAAYPFVLVNVTWMLFSGYHLFIKK
jgi:hypothetical protein